VVASLVGLSCAPSDGVFDAGGEDAGEVVVDAGPVDAGPTCGDSLADCGGAGDLPCCDGFTCEMGRCRGNAGVACEDHPGCVETLLCVMGECGACRDLAEGCVRNSECCGFYRCVEGFCGD